MNLKRLSVVFFSIQLGLVLPSAAHAVAFWKTIGLCTSELQAENLIGKFEDFGWREEALNEERAVDHSAMFNLHYHVAWTDGKDQSVITQLGHPQYLRKPAGPDDWDYFFVDSESDAVLTVRLLGDEHLCMVTSSRALIRVLQKITGRSEVYDFKIGRFAKNDTSIVLYNRQVVKKLTAHRFDEAVDLRYPFVAFVSNEENGKQ